MEQVHKICNRKHVSFKYYDFYRITQLWYNLIPKLWDTCDHKVTISHLSSYQLELRSFISTSPESWAFMSLPNDSKRHRKGPAYGRHRCPTLVYTQTLSHYMKESNCRLIGEELKISNFYRCIWFTILYNKIWLEVRRHKDLKVVESYFSR